MIMETYEKKYKEALEKARQLCAYPTSKPFISDLQDIFSELKESEEEKTKRLLHTIANKMSQHLRDIFTEEEFQCFDAWSNAWLEKQSEQKTVVIIPKFRVGDVIRPKGSAAEYTIESISGEYYHGKGWGLHISNDEDYELVEQKPTEWRQDNVEELTEFENTMMHIGGSFFGDNAGLDPNDTNVVKEQANLLLELVPSKEWSEEDETMIALLHNIIGHHYSMDIIKKEEQLKLENWLKSLRPQNTWKPSKEQMEALKSSTYCQDEQMSKELFELYQQLKKLKEE